LYFDRPDDPAATLFSNVDRVSVCLCDKAHWRRIGKGNGRPVRHQIRQVRNATDAYKNCTSDWLLHCDADEFLWPTQTITALLAEVYPWIDGAVAPVAERFHSMGAPPSHVFSGKFRRPAAGKGEAGSLTLRGLTGHAIGKAFTRVGLDLTVSIHRPQRNDPPLKIAPLHGLELLHFDGLTRLQWVQKLLRKADAVANHNGIPPSPHRQTQIDAVLHDPAAAFALHDRLKLLSDDQVAALGDLVIAPAFDPSEALAAVFGTSALLDPGQFDAWLMDQKADALPLLRTVS
jgi:hypothetical protein